MSPITGREVITVNGVRVAYQGLAALKPGVSVQDAAERTKDNGLDELLVTVAGPDGQARRLLVWGDALDFGFRASQAPPVVTVDGAPARLAHHEDEAVGLLERLGRGFTEGFKEAGQSVSTMARRTVEGSPYVGAAALVAGVGLAFVARAEAFGIIRNGLIVLTPKLLSGAGLTAAGAAGVMVAMSVVRAVAGGAGKAKMETIAAVTDDAPPPFMASPPAMVAPPAPPAAAPVAAAAASPPAPAPRKKAKPAVRAGSRPPAPRAPGRARPRPR